MRYKHILNSVCSCGVHELAEAHQCYWLLDAIVSWQSKAKQDAMLRQIQFWKLTVNPDKTAVLTCERDSGDVAITQNIEYTDLDLPEVRIWVRFEGNTAVMYLPEEH